MDHLVVQRRRCVAQSLSEILPLEERVLRKYVRRITMGGQQFQHPPDRDPHPADARLATALARVATPSV